MRQLLWGSLMRCPRKTQPVRIGDLTAAVIAAKEDRGREERAIQEENTALARFRSEENPGSGPVVPGVYPNHRRRP